MHTLTLKVQDSIYAHIMFLLQNLNTKELEIVEDIAVEAPAIQKDCVDFSAYSIKAFQTIDDPVKWQQELRSEWDKV